MPARMEPPPADLASAAAGRSAAAAAAAVSSRAGVSAFASGGRRGSRSSGNNNSVDAQQQKEAEEDALMNEMLSKHRSEMQKFIGRAALGGGGDDDDDDDDSHALDFGDAESPPPPPPPPSSGAGGFHDELYDELPSPDGFQTPRPVRSKTAERLLELSRTEEALRSDRMRLAELSDVRNERLGREVISRWNPQAKAARRSFERHAGGRRSPTARAPAPPATASPRTSAKILGYSKDFVQQALDFNGHDMDDDDDDVLALADAQSPTTRGLRGDASGAGFVVGGDEDFRGRQSQVELRRYVKQMEETIAQLVQQKDELLRNQAEFDKHASGIFPSLEHLNHQLSQIVQGKMANSQVNIKEDVFDEIRIQGEKLEELESETKRRHHDADVLEENRAIEITQIKGQIVSLVTSGKLRDEKVELITDSVEKLQVELQETTKGLVQRCQLIEKRVSQLQTPMSQPWLVTRRPNQSHLMVAAAVAVAFVAAVATSVLFSMRGSCGAFGQCTPLT